MAGMNGTRLMIEGQVTAANSHGIKVDSEPDWVNFSKFAKPEDLQAPAIGSRVALTLDKSGFIRKVEALEAAQQAVQQAVPPPAQNGAPGVPPAQGQAHTGPAALVFDKDIRITRMASVNSAVNILGHNERTYTLEDVLEVAGQIEQWVTR